MTTEESICLRQLCEAELQRLDAEYALEAPSIIAALLAKDTTPFDDYVAEEQLWQRFATALVKADVRGVNGPQCTIDDFMLMNVTPTGEAHFKDHVTRQYIVLETNGNLTAEGSYYHWPFQGIKP
jgi:hypothetical protein